MISALLGRFAPYIILVLGLAVVGSGVASWVLSARLDAATERADRVQAERDAAAAASLKFEENARRAAEAQRVLNQDLVVLRGKYEKLSVTLRKIDNDGCLDRNHPVDIGGLLADGDSGAGKSTSPAVVRPTPGP